MYTKETRQKRLQEAQIDKDDKIIQIIRREAGAFGILKQKPRVGVRKANPDYYGTPRLVFISLTQLEKEWQRIEVEALENAIFVFDAERSWVFPSEDEPKMPDHFFDASYFKCSDEFRELLR